MTMYRIVDSDTVRQLIYRAELENFVSGGRSINMVNHFSYGAYKYINFCLKLKGKSSIQHNER